MVFCQKKSTHGLGWAGPGQAHPMRSSATYTVNAVTVEYLSLGKLTAANILILLVWWWELSFDAKMSSLARLQYKHLHCERY